MKKMILLLIPMALVLGLVLQAQALQPAALPASAPAAVDGCSVDLTPSDAEPTQWPLRPSFLQTPLLETGLFCHACQVHPDCVSVCGVPWAACIPDFGCGSGRYCFCN